MSEPFRSVVIDLVGLLPKGKGGTVSVHLRMYGPGGRKRCPLKGLTSPEVAEAFVSIVSRRGIPDAVLSDQGTVFTGKIFRRVCEILGCSRILTTPYHPQGNGVIERMYGTLKPMLAKAS